MTKINSSCNENFNIKSRNVASKNPAVTALQDLLFYQISILGFFAKRITNFKLLDKNLNNKIIYLICLTNKGVNYSIPCMMKAIKETHNLIIKIENLYKDFCKKNKKSCIMPSLKYYKTIGENLSELVSLANIINAKKSIEFENFDIFALQELLRQSISASATHIMHIQQETIVDNFIYKKLYDILDFLSGEKRTIEKTKEYILKSGELNSIVIEFLFEALEKNYGKIKKVSVNVSPQKGHSILVAGDDFKFLKNLLEKTKDKDINIYTYGNLNYVHVFSEFQKYKHLKGIYFGKYTNLTGDIESFKGAVVLSSGNIENLDDIFRGRIFTTEEISILGVGNIKDDNFQPLLNAAYDSQGYSSDFKQENISMGFELNDINKIADKIYAQMKEKNMKNILLLIGCNNFGEEKSYEKKIIKILKKNSVFISLGCFECRMFKYSNDDFSKIINFGPLANIYNVIKILFILTKKLQKDISQMPLDIIINLSTPSYIAILFTLLSFGIKNIKINSELPIYLTNCLLREFGNEYNLQKIHSAKSDANEIIQKNIMN